ncbi:DNA-directed RNA polymerase III subunit RPC3 [Copidosoma floridanum]|uniref:DNA-directed RNA polymerase III subunit RPC3 n=1 Tax=Copidosoma floridanum TaxID=29053 RepID=UPI0006C9DE7E|nr:DNA-directed RNA polymerase III subunit RPC3 [Copidosoma floridanum]
MSLILRKLCECLLHEHFGSIVTEVAAELFKHGTRTLSQITSSVKIPSVKIKEAMCVLVKFGFVMYEPTDRGLIYTLETDKIVTILRYPKYMYHVKLIIGDEAEMMLEEVLKSGYESASQIIVKTYQRLEHLPPERRATVPVLKEKFELLLQHQYLLRSLSSETLSDLPTDKPDFSLPDLNIKAITRLTQGYEADAGDKKIYWRVNIDRFNEDLRDQILVNAITRRIDDKAGELMRQLLYIMSIRTAAWSDTSIPIPLNDIRESIRKNVPHLIPHLDQYMSLIVDDSSQFIQRVGDSGGGQYSINIREAFYQLAWATIEHIVMERFGSKASRIFRLIRSYKYIDQEKIQHVAMLGSKEAKLLTFNLMEEKYLQIQELKKLGVTTGPTKIFFLFHIDINQVVRMTIEHCYHSLYNIIQRRGHEVNSNKRMIDKELRMQTLTINMKEHGAPEEQLAEIADMMTPAEKIQLEQVHERIKKLGSNEFCIDETLFLLEMYIRYHK